MKKNKAHFRLKKVYMKEQKSLQQELKEAPVSLCLKVSVELTLHRKMHPSTENSFRKKMSFWKMDVSNWKKSLTSENLFSKVAVSNSEAQGHKSRFIVSKTVGKYS